MILHIICQDNLETVRYLYLDAEKQYVGATIGVGSYIVDASLACAGGELFFYRS